MAKTMFMKCSTYIYLLPAIFLTTLLAGEILEETPWVEPHEMNFYFKSTGVHPHGVPVHYPSQFEKFSDDNTIGNNPYNPAIVEVKSGADISFVHDSAERDPAYQVIKFEDENSLSKKTDQESYRLKIGDTLQIFLYGEEGSLQESTVDPMGNLTYLFVNDIPAAGKTISMIREILTNELKAYYKYIYLAITPVKVKGNFYTILGEVNEPGKKEIVGNATVTTALCEARGFTNRIFYNTTTDNAELSQSFISRKGEILPVDFERLIKEGDASQDIPLMQGDYIYIAPSDQRQVYILGEVGVSGVIDFLTTITLAEAIAQSGGLTTRASSRVVVIRGSIGCPTRFLIDINRIIKGHVCDFRLEPGDVVYVPPRKFTNLRELFRSAVATFVSTVASYAGTKAFVEIQPNAVGRVLSPVPIISTGNVSTFTAPAPVPTVVGPTP